jgi:NAD(P)-dependent dehydrogenase (short-subunit alcohol dehydrogenase family)
VSDVSRVSDVQAYLKNTMEQFGRVDITLLNAGIEGRVASISGQTEEDFDRVMAINTRGVWLGLKYTMPIMAEVGGAR